jgi:hypothetical protein
MQQCLQSLLARPQRIRPSRLPQESNKFDRKAATASSTSTTTTTAKVSNESKDVKESKNETSKIPIEVDASFPQLPSIFSSMIWNKIQTQLWEVACRELKQARAIEDRQDFMTIEEKEKEWKQLAMANRRDWQCPQCTYQNRGMLDRCELCDTKNDKQEKIPDMPAHLKVRSTTSKPPLVLPTLNLFPLSDFERLHASWSATQDENLIKCVNRRLGKDEKTSLNPITFTLTREEEVLFPDLVNDVQPVALKVCISSLSLIALIAHSFVYVS